MSLRSDVSRLAKHSAIYSIGGVLLRGIGFFLLPVVTRRLSPGDYGIVAVCLAVTAVLTSIFSLGLNGAIARFFFDDADVESRRRRMGTIWSTLAVSSLVLATCLELAGPALSRWVFPGVPYVPYLRLAVWTAFLNSLALVPLGILQVEQRSQVYVVLTSITSLLNAAAILSLVGGFSWGAYGYLLGVFLASLVMAAVYVGVAVRQVTLGIDRTVAAAALLYSLPLLPHSFAGWLLELSDRLVLERLASLTAVGLYSIGYQLGAVVTLFSTAINSAWVPYLFRADSEAGEGARHTVTRLITLYALVVGWVALGVAIFGGPVLRVMTDPKYHAAEAIVPWVAIGLALNGLYFVPANFLFMRSKTAHLAPITLTAGVVNLLLNLVLVPQFGFIAAAWSTAIAYGVMLFLCGYTAHRVYPVPYELKRLGKLGLAGGAVLLLNGSIPHFKDMAGVAIGMGIWATFPLVLFLLGFFNIREREMVVAIAARLLRAFQPANAKG